MNQEATAKAVFSKIYPPRTDAHFYRTYQHRDGRIVTIHYGPMSEKFDQKVLVQKKGNVAGTLGSVLYHEAFPDEAVCCFCVGSVGEGKYEDGSNIVMMMASSPTFRRNWGKLCPACLDLETERLKANLVRELSWIGIKAKVTIEREE